MLQQLYSYDGYILAFIALTGTVFAAMFLVWLTQRSGYSARIKEFRGVAAPFIGIPGILFALNLVFLANDTWNAHDRAQQAVYQEAGALRGILTVAKLLPDPNRPLLNKGVAAYIDHATTIEWPKLALRQTASLVDDDIERLMGLAMSRTVGDALDRDARTYLISQIEQVKVAHAQRVILSKTHINALKWLSMAVLGLITMISIVMVHVDQAKAELLAVALFVVAATPTAVIVLVQGNPFQQPTALAPTPIQCVVQPVGACDRRPGDAPESVGAAP